MPVLGNHPICNLQGRKVTSGQLGHAGHHASEDEQRGRSLRKIAKWVTRLLGTADLTPSDSAVALVLVATLQRQARR